MNKILFFFLLIFSVSLVYSQSMDKDSFIKSEAFISDFIEDNEVTHFEKLKIKCEYSLLYEQYLNENNTDFSALENSYKAILNNFRQTGSLDTTHRLYLVDYTHFDIDHIHESRISEINFVYAPQMKGGSNDKPIGGDDDFTEKANYCTNADFENGNFDDWALAWANGGGPGNLVPGINNGGLNSTTGNHAIMGPGAGTDANTGGNVPRVYPGGGQYSFRLGDQGTGYNAARATYSFTITPQTELFIYHYAVVMEDPGHSASQQPFLKITLTINGVDESCGYYYQAASGSAPGYQTYTSGFSTIRYKNWETVSISLTPYMGQTAKVEFITADCSQSGHFGYAYIDAECMPMPTLPGETLSCLNPIQTISGPPGASGYSWTGPGIVGPSNVKDIQVNQAGTYTVTVIPVQGPQCAYSFNVVVEEDIGDVVADFIAIPDQVCLGTEIDFTNTSITSGTTGDIDIFDWQFGDGGSSGDENPTHLYTTPGVYNVELTITTEHNCVGTTTKNVTVLPFPDADFSATPVCEDAVALFTDLSTIDPNYTDVISSWHWDFGDGNTSTSQNPTHQYAGEGVYDVTLTIETNTGCVNSVTYPLEIYPLPVVNFAADTVCHNDYTSLVDLSTVDNTNTTNQIVGWSWDFGDGNMSTDQNPQNTYPDEGFFNAELTVTTDHGCSSTSSGQIAVYPNPVVNYVPSTVCLHSISTFTDNSTVNNSNTSNDIVGWFWDFGDGSTATTQNTQHIFSGDGTFMTYLTVTTDHGCSSIDSIEVTVLPNPTADFIADSICQGNLTSFVDQSQADPNNGDFIASWHWDFGDGNSSTMQNPFNLYDVENVYTIQLNIVTAYGCLDSVIKTTIVYPNPEPDFSSTSVCLESETSFTDLSTVSNNNSSNQVVEWEWNFGDGNTSDVQNPGNTYPNEGFFNAELTVTTEHGCYTTVVNEVTIYPNPVVNFVPTEVCHEAPTDFYDQSTVSNMYTDNDIVDWNWNFGDGSTSTEQNPEHTFYTEGVYDAVLTVTTNHGCVSTDTIQVTVFPNPVADFFIDSVCQGITSTIQDLSTINNANGDYINQWLWNFGNGQTSIDQNPIQLYNAENVYDVTLKVISNNGCEDEKIKVTEIYPVPVVSFSATDVCIEFTTEFTDHSTVSNNHTSNQIIDWSWDFDDGNTSNIQNPDHDYANDGTYHPVLTVTTNHGCISSGSIPVPVYPKPVASFTGIDLEGCSPVCPIVTSTSTINNPSTIVNYLWTLSDGTTYEGSSPIMTDCYINDTGYDITYGLHLLVTSEHGCIDEHNEDDYIKVYHNPIANFYYDPTDPDVVDPVVQLYNTSLYADSYLWNVDHYGSSTEFEFGITFPFEPNIYTTELIAYTDYGCTDTMRIAIEILDRLIFYVPNTFTPDNDDYNEVFKPIFANGVDPQNYTLLIFNRWGEVIFESHDLNRGWDGTYGVGSSRIVKDGTYIWKINFKESKYDKHHSYSGHVNLLK